MSAVSISSSCSHQLHHSSKELITSHSLASIHFPRKGQNTSTNFDDINNECRAKSCVKAAPQRLKWRTRVSFFPSFSIKDGDIETLKQELLEAIAPLDRGAEATAEDQERVDQGGCRPKIELASRWIKLLRLV